MCGWLPAATESGSTVEQAACGTAPILCCLLPPCSPFSAEGFGAGRATWVLRLLQVLPDDLHFGPLHFNSPSCWLRHIAADRKSHIFFPTRLRRATVWEQQIRAIGSFGNSKSSRLHLLSFAACLLLQLRCHRRLLQLCRRIIAALDLCLCFLGINILHEPSNVLWVLLQGGHVCGMGNMDGKQAIVH